MAHEIIENIHFAFLNIQVQGTSFLFSEDIYLRYIYTQEIYIVSQYEMCITIYRDFSFFSYNCSCFIHIISCSNIKSRRNMLVTFFPL